MAEPRRRVNAVRAARSCSERESESGSDATRADYIAYARGDMAIAELAVRVGSRCNAL